ncbi:hypothetical protein GS836_24320 [Rhodococcus hoagii]|nr:hypothetical protein [Prescottella equi]
MTDVVDDMFTIAGRRGNGVATIRSTVLRPANASTGAITPDDHRFDIVAGRLEMRNLDPGPAELHIRMDTWVMPWKKVSIPVSTTPVTLRTLIEDYIEYEPGVVSQTRANADLAEASAVRSESAAARAEGSEQYVQGVIDDGAAAVRAEVQSNADAAVTAASNAATSRSGAETARTDAANSKTAAAGSATAASDSATTAGQHKAAAESAATTAGQHRSAAETAATTAGQHRAAAETARAGAESAADTAAIDAASIVADNLAATVAADRAAAQSAETAATSSATLAASTATTLKRSRLRPTHQRRRRKLPGSPLSRPRRTRSRAFPLAVGREANSSRVCRMICSARGPRCRSCLLQPRRRRAVSDSLVISLVPLRSRGSRREPSRRRMSRMLRSHGRSSRTT